MTATLTTLAASAVAGGVVQRVGARDPGPSATATSSRAGPATSGGAVGSAAATGRWLAVLDAIDDRRADAWRRGEPALLRRVYVAGAAELSEDRSMLAGYRRRGLTVSHVQMRFLSVRVTDRRPEGVALVVIDRLGPAVARDAAGRRHELPRDLPTRHEIELHRVGREWRIASITVV